MITDATGVVVEETKYDPWGKINAGGTASKFAYTGQEHDSETGLHYYGARYYDPEIKRFAQPDTLLPNIYAPQQLNRYAYANNNPLKYIDPSGHVSILDWNNFLSHPTATNYNNVMTQFANIPGNTAAQSFSTRVDAPNNNNSNNTNNNPAPQKEPSAKTTFTKPTSVAKDFERFGKTVRNWIFLAMTRLMLKRLGKLYG